MRKRFSVFYFTDLTKLVPDAFGKADGMKGVWSQILNHMGSNGFTFVSIIPHPDADLYVFTQEDDATTPVRF